MVNIHERTTLRVIPRVDRLHGVSERPPDPLSLWKNGSMDDTVARLVDWLSSTRNIVCITGAGLSTESGIPDYRGHKGAYHTGHKPMIHDQFMSSEAWRQRYWGRSMVGWKKFDKTAPNSGHYALSELERLGMIGVPVSTRERDDESSRLSIITQNVDSLHIRAGANHVTELHGNASRLRCMKCGGFCSRDDFQRKLSNLNHEWLQRALLQKKNEQRPDGDASLSQDNTKEFYRDIVVPPCPHCGVGFLKPDVVFFGDVVPKDRVSRCYEAVEASEGLLCIGSSLAVHSAFRFVRAAAQQTKPICILNVGETRADKEGIAGILKLEAPAGLALSACVEHLLTGTEPANERTIGASMM